MIVEQFFDTGLAHLSYGLISEGQMVVIDPGREPQPYYDLAENQGAKIVAVIETHPHADFVSCHLEMMTNGAVIYASKLLGALYPFKPFDEGDELKIGGIKLKAINTPGHSPDSISILLLDEKGHESAVFTGDTLFVGDVGRPDLRETTGSNTAKKEILAKQMYSSLRNKLMNLPDDILVYPAHGPGSLCGKSLGAELFSTIAQEKKTNYALQPMDESSFVKLLLNNQPFVPKYFPYDVELNRMGVPPLEESIKKIKNIASEKEIEANSIIVDTRPEAMFKSGHLHGAINIQNGTKFETYLGAIISPEEKFYLIGENNAELDKLKRKAAKIGYELNIKGALAKNEFKAEREESLDMEDFTKHLSDFTIVDIRNDSEVEGGKLFEHSIHIPLPELRERLEEIPYGKPIVVHCAGGYRSAAGSSILRSKFQDKVFDLSEEVKKFQAIKN
jgi:glyoxylase-like metal-dependent hydrolase (beta-lactamase superfamily II)/rhodanese-related sulfurtransferase